MNIPITFTAIENKLLAHPDNPSILSLKDVLSFFKVDNEVIKVNKDEFGLDQLELPVILDLIEKDLHFVLLEKIENEQVIISDEKKTRRIMDINKFRQVWGGHILIAEKNESSGEPNFKKQQKIERLNLLRVPFLLMVLIMSISFFLAQRPESSFFYLLFWIKITGISICLLLLTYDIDPANAIAQRVCKLANPNGCYSILKSEASKVTDWLNWSEVGMIYFFGSFLFIVINPNSPEFLLILNILALPYTIYSIGYQIKHSNLCLLCCSVQILLWLEAATFYTNFSNFRWHFGPFQLLPIFCGIICFLIPAAVWAVIKPLLKKLKELKLVKSQLTNLKANRVIFHALLTSKDRYEIKSDLHPIVLGNINAKNTITIITNPFCSPCQKLHLFIEKWLTEDKALKVNFIIVTTDDFSDEKNRFANDIYVINIERGQDGVMEALNRWFKGDFKDFEDWTSHYHYQRNDEADKILQRQRNWLNGFDVIYTPAIFINGYKAPWQYSIDEIRYLLT